MADGTYDLVLCSQVLEHIPEPLLVLKEIRRVLKPGGNHGLAHRDFMKKTKYLTTSTAIRNFLGGEWRQKPVLL